MTDNSKNTILVVDDEEGILEITQEYFERRGYEVYTASNGIEAIKIIESVKIGCCFTDINMPEMDGLELAEHIRSLDNTLPVIVMTGYPSLENTIRTLKNGVVDYLVKPVNLEQMELSLRRIMRERGLFVENLILREEIERKARLKSLNDELLARVDELNVLNRIMEDFSFSDSTYGIFNKVVKIGMEVVKADKVNFYINSEQEMSFVPIASTNYHDNIAEELSLELRDFFLDVIADDKPCLISKNCGAVGLAEHIQSFMVVPVKIREKPFGVVTACIVDKANIDKINRFTEKDIYYMSFIARKAASAIENIALYENIYDNLFSTLYAFVAALEARDSYTRKHSTRVSEVAYVVGKAMGCSEEELDILSFAGQLHDIGKIGIRDDILLKPGRLTDEEFEKIKEHPAIGADIVGKLGLWDREQEIIRHHHEFFDGRGYPDGLKGDEIPKLARILSVGDAFDAMSSDRAYRKKMEKAKVISIIQGCSGTQFDPEVVDVFMTIVDDVWPHDS
ncbi:MAG: response regulator [Desulfamplus sp.]|nr:response regulator [Desulfamplus sp.]MBF0257578.1 response regulator [Desulfamplus sp.]